MKHKATIIKFLRRELLFASNNESDKPTSIRLLHILGQNQTSPLSDQHAKSIEEYDDDSIIELADEFLEIAQEDADSRSGPSSYCLMVMVGKEARVKSPNWRLAPNTNGVPVGDTEPGTKDGLLSQAYRHIEAQSRTMVSMYESTIGTLTETVNRQANHIERLEGNHMKVVEERENMLNEQHIRNLDTKREELREQRYDQALKTITPLVPALANRLLAGANKSALIPENQKPMLVSLKDIIDSLEPKQIEQIMQALGSKSIALMEILTQIEEAANAEKSDSSN